MSDLLLSNYNAVKSPLKKQQTHYEIIPKVVRSNARADFRITPFFDGVRFSGEYRVRMTPVMQIYNGKVITVETEALSDGSLHFSADMGDEQEYNVYVAAKNGDGWRDIEVFSIYALDADLYECRPYRGDMHIHSYCSDGREDPRYVAASYRRVGFDFIAITDHHRYTPSVEAKNYWDKYDIDLALSYGEEVHAPENNVHIINFGGSFSVNEIFQKDPDRYYAEVREIVKTVTDYPEPEATADIFMYAACKWVFSKIREGGGISIFCHPYWRVGEGFHISNTLTEYILTKKDFDAYEVIGGYERYDVDSNILQVAKYNDMRAKGERIPIVGVSDSHGCDRDCLMNWYSTIVFAKSPALCDIKEAITSYKSVACESAAGEMPRVYGEFRYVAYAYFVMREIFPLHDVECSAEGAHMQRITMGDTAAATALNACKGTTTRYLEHLWGNE